MKNTATISFIILMVIIIAMVAFPPWTGHFRTSERYISRPMGYHFIASNPDPREAFPKEYSNEMLFGSSINTGLLALQLGAISFLWVAFYIALNHKQKRKDPND